MRYVPSTPRRGLCLGVAFVTLLAAGRAHAAPAYGTTAPVSGQRAIGAHGLMSNDPDWTDARLDWLVSPNQNNTFTYTYTLTNLDRPTISYFALDLTDDAIAGSSLADPAAVTDFKINGVAAGPVEFGDFNGITGAVKFDAGDPETTENLVTYSFVSDRAPVWGHLYIKAGRQTTLRNTGLFDPDSSDVLDFVARPDGVAVGIPEPGSVAVFALAATHLLARRRRRAGAWVN